MNILARVVGWLTAALAAWRARRSRGAPGLAPGTVAARAAQEAPPKGAVDPSERTVPSSRRAETFVAALLVLAAVLAFGFTAVYAALRTNTQLLGISLGGALLSLAAAAIVAGKFVVPQETSVEERDRLLDDEQVDEVAELVEAGGDGLSRRGLLVGAGGLAGAAMVTAAATPLASLGPRLTDIHDTPWHEGVRLVDDEGRPYAASEIQIGSFYTALPEGGDPELLASGLLVVRLPAAMIQLPSSRRGWAPEGILGFSKICPHAACAISLYRYPTNASTSPGPAFTCPCHYSTFSPGEGGKLLFGPAGRPLPQLPLAVDPEGNLRAAGRFDEDTGPSWWSVRRT
jgi:ubiquinol-cytochrome c reductase iron-sulfur subunit